MNSTITDLVIRIKNGSMAGKERISSTYSKMIMETLRILKREGYIKDFSLVEDSKKKSIKIELMYIGKKPAVKDVKIISKPGQRIYKNAKNIETVLGGLGLIVISTSKGILTGKEARKSNAGGEVLFKIW